MNIVSGLDLLLCLVILMGIGYEVFLNIAMPHAQENAQGVNSSAIAFMKSEEPVHFEENNPDKDARLFFVLASKDHNVHLENMEKLALVLLNEDLVNDLLKVNSVEGLLEIDAKYA